ncbi:MAG: thioesterase [Planctomyces sp.]|nr:thioesterase [Planctomyces sp.]
MNDDEFLPGLGTRDVPYLDLLGVKPVRRDNGDYEFRMKVEHQHLRPYGIIHGGAIASLLDTALGMSVGIAADVGMHMVTVQLNINYIRPTWEGEEIIAHGELQHKGGKTAVARGEVRTVDGTLIATASGTFMYLPMPKGAVMEKKD